MMYVLNYAVGDKFAVGNSKVAGLVFRISLSLALKTKT